MELLELYLSPLDAQRFQAIATCLPVGVGDAATDCVLPFWVGEQDWRRTIIKVLESSQGFRAEHYPELSEQAWLEQEELLLPIAKTFMLPI
jgi:hypothetical protein